MNKNVTKNHQFYSKIFQTKITYHVEILILCPRTSIKHSNCLENVYTDRLFLRWAHFKYFEYWIEGRIVYQTIFASNVDRETLQ